MRGREVRLVAVGRAVVVGGALVVSVVVLLYTLMPTRTDRPPGVAAPVTPSRIPSAVGQGNLLPLTLAGVGRFESPGSGAAAVSYDPDFVPAGAWGAGSLASAGPSTLTALSVAGLVPGRRYSAVMHVRRCGSRETDSGPEFLVNPGAGSGAANEIRLTGRTGSAGDWFEPDHAGAITLTTEDPALTPDRPPGSIVLHAGPAPSTGRLGRVVGCLSLS